jgi:hypothetical protein
VPGSSKLMPLMPRAVTPFLQVALLTVNATPLEEVYFVSSRVSPGAQEVAARDAAEATMTNVSDVPLNEISDILAKRAKTERMRAIMLLELLGQVGLFLKIMLHILGVFILLSTRDSFRDHRQLTFTAAVQRLLAISTVLEGAEEELARAYLYSKSLWKGTLSWRNNRSWHKTAIWSVGKLVSHSSETMRNARGKIVQKGTKKQPGIKRKG